MFRLFKWRKKRPASSDDTEQKEIESIKTKFNDFIFSDIYHDLFYHHFLFLDKNNKKIGVYKKKKRIGNDFVPEVIRTIPFTEIKGLTVFEDNEEIFCLGPKQLQFGIDEDEISLFINSLDDDLKEGEFSKLDLQILAFENERFNINFYDDHHPRSDMRKSIRTLKRWFQMIATCMLLEQARKRRKKIKEEKRIFIEIYKTDYKCRSTPFYFVDIFHNLETIFRELKRGPFAEVNYHQLQIEAFRNGTLIFRDVDQMYDNTELHHKWLKIVVGRWGITDVKVLRAKAPSERVNLADEPDLIDKFMKELLYFASFDQMTKKLQHAKVSRVRGRRIYIQCEARYEEELYHWWERVKVNNDWLQDYIRAFLGKEYEIIFESGVTDTAFVSITKENYKTIWHEATEGGKLRDFAVQKFANDTYYIYFENPIYMTEKKLRILYERKKVEEALKRLTGKEIRVEIIDPPENVQAERIANIKYWMEKKKDSREKMAFALINETSYGLIYAVFVDDSLYIYDGKEDNDEPYFEHILKRDINFVPDIQSKVNVYIRDIVLKMSKEEAKAFKQYIEELHEWQLNIMENIEKQMNDDDRVIDLLLKFYEKEVKDRFCLLQLDHILNGEHALEDEMEKLSRMLIRRIYIDEKEHLLMETIRRKVFEIAIEDIANTFQKNSEGLFTNPSTLSKEEMFEKYYKRLFSDVENIDDVAAFTAFLLHHKKIDLNKCFYQTVLSVKDQLLSVSDEKIPSEI